ncbi:MAG: ATP-dependent helicase, partial [Actinobacteria bacterium]|nr:ATP-dependent helicase [Actinomycetota bacterium]
LKLGGLINLIFERSGLADELRSDFSKVIKQKVKNIETLIKISSDFEPASSEASIESFIIYLRDAAKTEEEDPENVEFSKNNSIKIMSIHAAKGLEFKAVFMPSLSNNDYAGKTLHRRFKMPSILRKDKSVYKDIKKYTSLKKFNQELKEYNIEEERRIFYVGCSRAENYLFLSASDDKKNPPNLQHEALDFLKDIIPADNLIPLNMDGRNYLKESFGYDSPAYFKSFKKYIEKTVGKENIKPGVLLRQESKKTPDFFDYCMGGKSEYALSAMSDFITFKKQKISKTEDILKEYGLNAWTEFFQELNPLPESIRQYIKVIKKAKDFSPNYGVKKSSMAKKHFSLTEILNYCRCPSFYRWKYVFNIPEPLKDEADIGLKVHRHIQILTSIKYKDLMPKCLPAAADIDEKEYLEMIKENEKSPDVYPCVKNYFDSILYGFPDVLQIKVEQLFYWHLEGYVISCKVDRMDIGHDGHLRIIDYKTSGFKKGGEKDRYLEQLKAYACGLSSIYGTPADNISAYLLFLKDGHILKSAFDCAELKSFSLFLKQVIKNINSFMFEPCNSSLCSKECCYFELCH